MVNVTIQIGEAAAHNVLILVFGKQLLYLAWATASTSPLRASFHHQIYHYFSPQSIFGPR